MNPSESGPRFDRFKKRKRPVSGMMTFVIMLTALLLVFYAQRALKKSAAKSAPKQEETRKATYLEKMENVTKVKR